MFLKTSMATAHTEGTARTAANQWQEEIVSASKNELAAQVDLGIVEEDAAADDNIYGAAALPEDAKDIDDYDDEPAYADAADDYDDLPMTERRPDDDLPMTTMTSDAPETNGQSGHDPGGRGYRDKSGDKRLLSPRAPSALGAA